MNRPQRTLGPWLLTELLGRGAFGETWRGERADGRLAAVKTLPGAPGDELRALAGICHPAVVGVLGAGSDPQPWIAMELAPGQPLSEVPLDGISVEVVGAALCDALAAVHGAEVIHGDVKPDNLLVDPSSPSPLRLVDFGLVGGDGGTPDYAAPEVLTGGQGGVESDVFSAGLVLYERLEGHLPYTGRPSGQALALRATGVPPVENGPPWLRELIDGMLHVSPDRRPTALEAADAFESRGYPLAALDGAFIGRRSGTVWIERPGLESALEGWVRSGGSLAVLGGPGSGRTQALAKARIELLARGRSVLHVRPSGGEGWSAVAAAIAVGGIEVPLPEGADMHGRADRWAQDIAAALPPRGAVLVDDIEQLDTASTWVIRALASGGVPVLVAGAEAGWCPAHVSLEPLVEGGIRSLVRRLLGSADPLEVVCASAAAATEGAPGAIVAWVAGAVEAGVLMRRRGRWIWDDAALQRFRPALKGGWEPTDEDLAILGPLAVRRDPVGLDVLARMAGRSEAELVAELDVLVASGRVYVAQGQVRLTSARVQGVVLERVADPAALHRAWLDEPRGEPVLTARHAVGAAAAALAAEVGEEAVLSLLRADAVAAADLADALWALVPDPARVATRVRALARSGRHDEAERAARKYVVDDRADVVALWIEIAGIEATHRGDQDRALTALGYARAALGGEPPPRRLIVAEASARYHLGELKAAIDTSVILAAEPAPVDDDEALEDWLRARYLWAQALHESGDLPGALGVLEAVPPGLGHGLPAYGVLTAAVGRLLWFAGRYEDAQAALDRAGADDAGLSLLDRARLVNNLGAVRYSVGDTAGALGAWERAREMFRRLDVALEVVRTEVNLCLAYTEAGRWDRAEAAGEAACVESRRHEAHDLTCLAMDNLAQLAMARGDLAGAAARLEAAIALAKRETLVREGVSVMVRAAEVAAMLESADAFERAMLAEEAASSANMAGERSLAGALMAVGYARAGDGSSARAEVQRAIAPLREAGLARELAQVRLWVAETWLWLGRPEDATAEVSRAAVYAREVGHQPLAARADAIESRIVQANEPSSVDADLDRLVKLAVAIGGRRELTEVFDSIADAALDLAGGERVCVLVGDPAQVVVERSRPGLTPGPISASVLQQAIRDGREVFALDVGERADLRERQSIAAMSLRSVVCVPMRHRDERVGAIYIDSAGASLEALTKVRRLVRGLAALAALAVVNARHLEEQVEHAATVASLVEQKKSEQALMGMAKELAATNSELRHVNVELEHATKAKSAFLASMSHEIRTPLSGVLGMARLLEDTPLNDVQSGFVQTICRSGDALLTIINDILDFSKIEARRMELESIPFDIRTCVEEVADVCAIQAQGKGLELIAHVEAAVPHRVVGDPVRLRQVLLNLCNNAVKFTDRGHVSIEVRLEADEDECTRLRVSVEDTGIGIPEDRVQRLFQAFSQVDSSTTRRFGGTGLGLAICRELIDLMGGSLGVNSDEGMGSTFWVSVPLGRHPEPETPIAPVGLAGAVVVDAWSLRRRPLVELLGSVGVPVTIHGALDEIDTDALPAGTAVLVCLPLSGAADRQVIAALRKRKGIRVFAWTTLADSSRIPSQGVFDGCISRPLKRERLLKALRGESVGAANRPVEAETVDRTGRRILLVEDNAVNQEIAFRALQRAGFEVEVAGDGRIAVERVANATWDVVLMDCQMPGMDGFEATRRIRAAEAEGVHVPIVAMTANAMDGDREACIEAGMDDYLAKPVHPRKLVAAVDAIIAATSCV